MSNPKFITPGQFALILLANELNNGSCEWIQYTSETTPKLNKKHRETGEPCPWSKVIKRTTAKASLKAIYENAVNNKWVKEGIQEKGENLFEAQGMKWGHFVEVDGKTSKIVIDNNGKYNVRLSFLNPNEKPVSVYLDEKGNEIPKEQLYPYLPPKKESNTVEVRSYGLDTFKEVHMQGQVYMISNG